MTASQNTSDAVLERARVREVTGVFHSRQALDAAANELLLMGFDRADVDVVASLDEIRKRLDVPYVAAEELADVPQVPRRPLIAAEDITVFKVVVAGVAFLLAARFFGRDEARGLDNLMATRGLILWVRVRSPEEETLAQDILMAHRAKAVRVHEIEIEKRPDDLPLGSLRPDPWLGSERLGQP